MDNTGNNTNDTNARTTDISKLTFDEAMASLEKIAAKLDGANNINFYDSIELYKTAMKYAKHCEELLRSSEEIVKILARDENGEVIEKDFEIK